MVFSNYSETVSEGNLGSLAQGLLRIQVSDFKRNLSRTAFFPADSYEYDKF